MQCSFDLRMPEPTSPVFASSDPMKSAAKNTCSPPPVDLEEVIEVYPKHGEHDRASKRIAEDRLTAVYASGEVPNPS